MHPLLPVSNEQRITPDLILAAIALNNQKVVIPKAKPTQFVF